MTPQPSELRTRLIEILNRNLTPWTFDGSEPFTQELLALLGGGGRSPEEPNDGITQNPLTGKFAKRGLRRWRSTTPGKLRSGSCAGRILPSCHQAIPCRR